MKIIYVPDWMRAALAAANVPVKDLYDVDKLLGTLSPEDVANYIHLNEHLEAILPEEVVASFDLVNFAGQVKDDECPRLRQVAKILGNLTVNGIVPSLDIEGKQITSDLMDEFTIRFTHVPLVEGQPTDESTRGNIGLLDRVIRQLYSFTPFQELVKLPIMNGYLLAARNAQSPTYVS